MIDLDHLQVPLTVCVGNITPDFIYFSGQYFEFIKAARTPELHADLMAIFGHEKDILWRYRQVELFQEDGRIRARKVNGGNMGSEDEN